MPLAQQQQQRPLMLCRLARAARAGRRRVVLYQAGRVGRAAPTPCCLDDLSGPARALSAAAPACAARSGDRASQIEEQGSIRRGGRAHVAALDEDEGRRAWTPCPSPRCAREQHRGSSPAVRRQGASARAAEREACVHDVRVAIRMRSAAQRAMRAVAVFGRPLRPPPNRISQACGRRHRGRRRTRTHQSRVVYLILLVRSSC